MGLQEISNEKKYEKNCKPWVGMYADVSGWLWNEKAADYDIVFGFKSNNWVFLDCYTGYVTI